VAAAAHARKLKGIGMKSHFKRLALIVTLILCLAVSSAAARAQTQNGSGVVIEGNPVGTDGIGSLNPLLCDNPYCRRITDFLFPTLYAVDPATGLVTGAAPDNVGLAISTEAPTGLTQQVRLRQDLNWSDGRPVTAYDLFYSYLAVTSQYVSTPYAAIRVLIPVARVIDEYTIEFAYNRADCTIPATDIFPIIPAHVFDPQFRQIVDDFDGDQDITAWFEAWNDFYPPWNFTVMNNHPFNTEPTVTAGMFTLDEVLPGEEIRLATPNGKTAFIYRDVESGLSPTQFFMNGDSNILVNPPYEMRSDLLANPDLQISELPGNTWDFISFNLANPGFQRGAIDGNGKPLEQGRHPIFGDVRVRRAIQMGIDVNALIEASLLGYGRPIASSRIPGTWAANNELQPLTYNPRGAEDLLAEAGWIDHDADGIRDCSGCLYAQEGRGLYFGLMVIGDGSREIAANLIARQLRQIGVWADVIVLDSNTVLSEVRDQEFDAYMGGWTQRYPNEPDQTALFTQRGDVLYTGANAGSYANSQVDELMAQALTLPGCVPAERAAIYHDIQAILQQDQPYVWLYAARDMVVGRGLDGFAPYPNRPFWNILDWNVVAS
jgi:peptide/nickel transport system substrate-binding protein